MESANRKPSTELRRGWTTGACATAALKAALEAFWGEGFPSTVQITLPKGETPEFPVAHQNSGPDWAEAGITKDAGDDPDVTHGALVCVRVSTGKDIIFEAGPGVGTITKPGLPIAVGQAAINPVPRQMMTDVVHEVAQKYGCTPDIKISVSIPGGEEIAQKTWNPRLGIKGGLSILGTTGIVRPFSCAAWIASIHRGVDVARADNLMHVAGCTGATSERTVQKLFNLPDHAMLDMGDFAGGLLKYLKKHPIPRLTIGGGIGKMTKLAQGAIDLHSSRSQVDFMALAKVIDAPNVAGANTAVHAYEIAGQTMADWVAETSKLRVRDLLADAQIDVDIVVIDRGGTILAQA